MGNPPISTRPLNDQDKLLRSKFYESIVAQSDQMDKLGERLFTLELTIPGLYATVLKLVAGDAATLKVNVALYITFICWLAALLLTVVALTPKTWKVDVSVLKQDPEKFSEGLGIEDFFFESATYKHRLLVASVLLFFAGISTSLFTLG